MRRIVVGIDFSKSSIQALKYALKVASKTASDLMLVYVSKKRDVEVEIFDEKKGRYINIHRNFKELIEHNQAGFHGTISYKILSGKIYEEITNQAKYTESGLIVVGAHGMSGYEEEWVGNNAYKIITHSQTPVIVIKKGFDFKNAVDKIVLPVDSSKETMQKLNYTIELAKSFKAQVLILSLINTKIGNTEEKVKENAKEALKQVSKAKLRYFTEEVQCESNMEATLEFAIRKEADLISIMTDQEFVSQNVLSGTYAEQLINQSPIPVLSFKTKKVPALKPEPVS